MSLDMSLPLRERPGSMAETEQQKPYDETAPRVRPESSSSQSLYSQRDSYDFDDFLRRNDAMSRRTEQDGDDMTPPALPQKSALRASRLLDRYGELKLAQPARTLTVAPAAAPTKDQQHMAGSTPHDVYLSSEEDASSSADDFSDFYSDFTDDEEEKGSETSTAEMTTTGPKSPVGRRRSHEITARAVSLTYVGKPAIIEVSPLRRRTSAASQPTGAARRESNAETVVSSSSSTSSPSHSRSPPLTRRTSTTSISTTTSATPAATASPKPSLGNFRLAQPPPSSGLSTPSTTTTSTPTSASTATFSAIKKRPPFLNIDPFANGSTYSLENKTTTAGGSDGLLSVSREDDGGNNTMNAGSTPRTPKTPTAMFRSMQRTLSLVRKRSRPAMASQKSPVAGSNNVATAEHEDERDDEHIDEDDNEVDMPTPPPPQQQPKQQRSSQGPVTYNDILRAAKRNASQAAPTTQESKSSNSSHFLPPISPVSPLLPSSGSITKRTTLLGGLAIGRRKSVKTGGRV